MINFAESLPGVLNTDVYHHSGIYDADPKKTWLVSASGKPIRAPVNKTFEGRVQLEFMKCSPNKFRKHFIKLLVHVASEQKVAEVQHHNKMLNSLKKLLPKEDGVLNGVIISHKTWTKRVKAAARYTTDPWLSFWERSKSISIYFDDKIPEDMVIGIGLPEFAGTLNVIPTVGSWGIGCFVNEEFVRAIKLVAHD